MPVSFSKEVNLGNFLSAAFTTSITLVGVTIFILSIQSGYKQENTKLEGRLDVSSAKLEQLTSEFKQYKAENVGANAEVRQKIDQVSTQIADLRVAIATLQRDLKR